jgi:hypothetical protein
MFKSAHPVHHEKNETNRKEQPDRKDKSTILKTFNHLQRRKLRNVNESHGKLNGIVALRAQSGYHDEVGDFGRSDAKTLGLARVH